MVTDARHLPEQFGRYRLLKPLGRGGMGAVYLAHDPQLDREVALKIPRLRGSDAEGRARFVREARAAATVRHPNVCPVYDIDEFGGVPYLTMAYIAGRTLSAVLKSAQRVPPRRAALLVRKVAGALQAAHQQGIIHRDLKPSNIMLDERNEPIVMDFGLARWTAADASRLTQSGAVVGTPSYMSPEQAAGDPAQIGPQTDIYSLGIVLYELLTGRPPFEGTVVSVLSQILTSEPEPPSQREPAVDAELEAVCLKALAKAKDQRFQTMPEFADALTAWLRGRATASGARVDARAADSAAAASAVETQRASSGGTVSRRRTNADPVSGRPRIGWWSLGGLVALLMVATTGLGLWLGVPAAVVPSGPDRSAQPVDRPPPQAVAARAAAESPTAPPAEAAPASEEGDWISLFNGTDLTGWRGLRKTKGKPVPDATGWEIRDGTLVRTAADEALLFSDQQFADAVLELEILLPEDSSLFVALRCGDSPREVLPVLLFDQVRLRRASADALKTPYVREFFQVSSHLRPAGEWNAVTIRCEGDELEVSINGNQAARLRISDFDGLDRVPRRGPVALIAQDNALGVTLRNLRIRELKVR